MAKRHDFRPGDWETIALRLDEIISAHSGEDPFEEALKLLVAKLAYEATGGEGQFLERGQQEQVSQLLATANRRWPGVLEPGTQSHLSAPELVRCAQALQSVRLLDGDLGGLDAIFEFVVNKAAKGQKGQYFTPRFVITEVVGMACLKPGERVADPACGSGGFLHHALLQQPKCSVWGFDQDSRAIRVARVVMSVSGQPATRVMRCDSLLRRGNTLFGDHAPGVEELMRAQEPKFRGFDAILTNPPFAGDVGSQYSDSYELARGKRVERDALFVERCVELLRPGGRLAIVLPYNKVGGSTWAYMRQWLLRRLQVIAVVSLGRATFMPHTSQKACVLVGVKRAKEVEPARDEEILFFISEREGKDHRGRLLYLGDGTTVDHDLGEAAHLVASRLQSAVQE